MFLPPGFDKLIALEAAGLVIQAYDQYDHFTKGTAWMLQGDYDLLGSFSAKPEGLFARLEPFGFVARNRTSLNVFVAIRGTQSPEDWMSDFTFPQVPHPWGHAEEGFSQIWNQCSADVQTFVRNAGAPPHVFVTGHSLGAGLAILAVAILVISGIAPGAIMYSFAGPRVGDLAFADKFNQSVAAAWRICNTEDIVTTVPLATPELFAGSHPHNPLGMILMLARSLNFEHVGVPVSFTTHKGSILDNHQMPVYVAALS